MNHRMFQTLRIISLIVIGFGVGLWTPRVWAAFGDDIEKPHPKFSQDGTAIVATLLPRAKSSNVQIRFGNQQGLPFEVTGVEFEAIRTPDLDIKEFKSAFFEVDIPGIPTGSEIVLEVSSDFFTSSTQYWVYRQDGAASWKNTAVKPVKQAEKVYAFRIPVQDGGPFDADGKADGKIRFIGGPKDGFWSYALGTLVIRFFGVFMVLSILMIGMMITGNLFVFFEKRKSTPVAAKASATIVPPRETADEQDAAAIATAIHLSRETTPDEAEALAAAIAVAIHLQQSSGVSAPAAMEIRNEWTLSGRQLLQESRLQVFLRPLGAK